MYSVFTTGYSNKIIWHSVDEDTLSITFKGDSEIEPNLSFASVDNVHKNIYFVHEVEKYEDFSHSATVSRWNIGYENKGDKNIPFVTKQEVNIP